MKRPRLQPRRPERLALTTTAILLGLATHGWAQVVPPNVPPPETTPLPTLPANFESVDTDPDANEITPLQETPTNPEEGLPDTSEMLLEPMEEEPLPTEAIEDLDTPGIRTTYLPSRLPWESPEVPDMPEWRANSSRFQNPAFGTSALGDSLPSGGSGLSRTTASNPIRLSLFDIYPSVGYTATYVTDLRSDGSSSATSDTWVHSFSPVLRIRAGSHWQLIYAPRIRFFSDENFNSSVNHNIGVSGWATYQDWAFRLNHHTAINNDPLIETGGQTEQSTHSTILGASMDRGSRGAYDFSLTQNLRLTDDSNNTYSWDVQSAYTYPLNDRIRIGGIFSVGYDLAPDAVDMVSERLNAFISGPLGNKLSYTLTGGVEFRQFIDSDASTAINPLVSLNLTYRVLTRTTLSLAASHFTSTSYFSDQFTENTTVQAILNQGLTDRWTASFKGGFRFRSYRSTALNNSVQREDTTSFVGGSLNGRLTQRISTSARYEFRMNDSDAANRDFESHQITLGLNWAL